MFGFLFFYPEMCLKGVNTQWVYSQGETQKPLERNDGKKTLDLKDTDFPLRSGFGEAEKHGRDTLVRMRPLNRQIPTSRELFAGFRKQTFPKGGRLRPHFGSQLGEVSGGKDSTEVTWRLNPLRRSQFRCSVFFRALGGFPQKFWDLIVASHACPEVID